MSKSKKGKLPKVRNPFVQHLIGKSGGGTHGKTKKAIRRQEKIDMKKKDYDKAA